MLLQIALFGGILSLYFLVLETGEGLALGHGFDVARSWISMRQRHLLFVDRALLAVLGDVW